MYLRNLYYKRNGEPYEGTLKEQAIQFEKDYRKGFYRRIKESILKNETWISTVWLGINHNHLPYGKPLIFETMVFPKEGTFTELDSNRYSTEEEAIKGHKRMVNKWKAKRSLTHKKGF